MRKFIIKIIGFFFIISIGAIVLDWAISSTLKQSNEYAGEFEVMNDIYGGKIKADIAIYGSSRAWVHINPKIIEDSLGKSTYNFGIDGHHFWLQYMRHLEYIKHNSKPKTILLAVDIFSLQKGKNLYNQNQFLPYMLWNKNIKHYTSSYNGYDILDYEIPFIRYYGKSSVLNICKSVLTKKDGIKKRRNKGFAGNNHQWNKDFEKAKKNNKKYTINLDQASIDLFEKFILECKEADIELIFVYTPEYIEVQEFIVNKESVVNIYNELSEKHQLLFLDYSVDSLSYDRDLFYNAMHLNSKGADLFTQKLASKLKEYWQE